MSDRADPPALAPIEDLDPEPDRTGGRALRWELVLGVLLVLGLAGFGGWQWWDQQSKQTNYRAGSGAAAAQDWDAAQAAFVAAGDYDDATGRATDAASKIAERNRQYTLATNAALSADWPHALLAAQRVQQIAPTYHDTASLVKQARQGVYDAALSGTVALRPSAAPPGLYAYWAGGWQWLPGSDTQSRLYATCSDGALLYDGTGGTPLPLVPSPLPPWRAAIEVNRHLLVATPAGVLTRRGPLTLDPAVSAYICTDSGLWSVYFAPERAGAFPTGLIPFGPYRWTYQAFGAAPAPVALPSPTWTMLDISPDGKRTLLLDATGATPARLGFRLYLADSAGANPQFLMDQTGSLLDTEFSPDGRYLLVTTHAEDQDWIFLADTGEAPIPVLLASGVQPQPYGYGAFAAFLYSGDHAGQAVLIWDSGSTRQLRLIAPDRPFAPLVDLPLAVPAGFISPFALTPRGAGLLLHDLPLQSAGAAAADQIIVLDAGNQAHILTPARGPGQYVGNAWLRGDHLLYATQRPGTPTRPASQYTLYSRALNDLDAAAPSAREIYSGTVQLPSAAIPASAPLPGVRLGPGLLAYIAPGNTLHVRSYDGAVDLALEAGVAALYNGAPHEVPYDTP